MKRALLPSTILTTCALLSMTVASPTHADSASLLSAELTNDLLVVTSSTGEKVDLHEITGVSGSSQKYLEGVDSNGLAVKAKLTYSAMDDPGELVEPRETKDYGYTSDGAVVKKRSVPLEANGRGTKELLLAQVDIENKTIFAAPEGHTLEHGSETGELASHNDSREVVKPNSENNPEQISINRADNTTSISTPSVADSIETAQENAPMMSHALYKTFVPDKELDLSSVEGWTCSNFTKFSGDNRDFKAPPAGDIAKALDPKTSRSSVTVSAMWPLTNPEQDLQTNIAIGETTAWKDGVAHRRTASADGIRVKGFEIDNQSIVAHVSHVAANPFCSVGAIQYTADLQMFRDGQTAIRSTHLRMPNHEAYARSSTHLEPIVKNWGLLGKDEYYSARCLVSPPVGPCAGNLLGNYDAH